MQEQIERELKTALLATMRHPFAVSHRAGKMEYILSGCSSGWIEDKICGNK